jgi:putative two-component system response regulator
MDEMIFTQYEKETDAPFTDSLTGLYNHGFFNTFLEMEVRKSLRYGDSFTVAIIDIDSFSLYNKHNGPIKGDRMLRDIAGIITAHIRRSDMAARYAGDVFALILVKSNSRDAFNAIERIRSAVESFTNGNLTVSAGLASSMKDAVDPDALVSAARDALLQSKIAGGNRAFFFQKKPVVGPEDRTHILVVDDEPRNVKYLEALLKTAGYDTLAAYNGYEALSMIEKTDVDLVLLDVMMPEMDGFDLCRQLKNNEATRMIPVVMVTALDDMESRVRGIEAGAEDFITKPPNKAELMARVRSLLKVSALNKRLISIENVLMSFANAVEAKDPYTEGHTRRVADLALAMGRKMGLSMKELDALRLGGILHDIGKIVVPSNVLNKPGCLDGEERKIMEKHTVVGHIICLPLEKTIGPALDIIRHHHEKLDGSGYPDGLKGDEISLLSRIMAVVDIYDSMITDRPYRTAVSKERALVLLTENADAGLLDKEAVNHLIGLKYEA